jgi:hypothetical protein
VPDRPARARLLFGKAAAELIWAGARAVRRPASRRRASGELNLPALLKLLPDVLPHRSPDDIPRRRGTRQRNGGPELKTGRTSLRSSGGRRLCRGDSGRLAPPLARRASRAALQVRCRSGSFPWRLGRNLPSYRILCIRASDFSFASLAVHSTQAHSADTEPTDARRSTTTTSKALRASCIIARPPAARVNQWTDVREGR